MATYKVFVLENGKPSARTSNAETFDFLSIKVGASALEMKETSGNFDMAGVKLVNVASGTASGQVLQWGQIGANNGVAGLDGGGKVPVAQLPNSIMEFQGVWNATTNSPTLADATGDIGDVYRVNVAGTQDLGSGSQTFIVGDWVMYDSGGIWRKAHAGADAVVSVNGAAGVVVLTTSDIAEGTNLYYTAARFNTAFSGKSTTDLAEGTNLYYTAARFNTAFSGKSTTDLAEGTNLYFTTARAKTAAVADAIADGVTDVAPSQNAVFDALALKTSSVVSLLNDTGSTIATQLVVRLTATGIALATNAASTAINTIGITTASIADAASGNVQVAKGTAVTMTGLTAGALYFLGTAGAITTTAPTANGTHVVRIGRALSTTLLLLDPEYVVENVS